MQIPTHIIPSSSSGIGLHLVWVTKPSRQPGNTQNKNLEVSIMKSRQWHRNRFMRPNQNPCREIPLGQFGEDMLTSPNRLDFPGEPGVWSGIDSTHGEAPMSIFGVDWGTGESWSAGDHLSAKLEAKGLDQPTSRPINDLWPPLEKPMIRPAPKTLHEWQGAELEANRKALVVCREHITSLENANIKLTADATKAKADAVAFFNALQNVKLDLSAFWNTDRSREIQRLISKVLNAPDPTQAEIAEFESESRTKEVITELSAEVARLRMALRSITQTSRNYCSEISQVAHVAMHPPIEEKKS